jgi:hypothetical protein
MGRIPGSKLKNNNININDEIVRKYLKNNPDLLNDIIKDLRKEKINKIKNI